ncbi:MULTISPECIES: hypothetical protein [unclassified Moorena]|uniref:hypothetical protein n=1 Tax=unclassified Moorena TaxID=2683338 RepID=UPI0014001FEA|nr:MULTISPECIES: hypothetical protein [unclassified Moorena]NEQ01276.1 hypothetical protein [Moorena sp. SIO3F7]
MHLLMGISPCSLAASLLDLCVQLPHTPHPTPHTPHPTLSPPQFLSYILETTKLRNPLR